MRNGKKICAIIPARAGSKRIPDKNKKYFAGRPLIDWTILAAQACPWIDQIIVSSDDPWIVDHARELGVDAPFIRPQELASDDARTMDVIFHALSYVEQPDVVICLQPTSPLRDATDLSQCLDWMLQNQFPSVLSVYELQKPSNWLYEMQSDDTISKTQPELDKTYVFPNGAIYVANYAWLMQHEKFSVFNETKAFRMPFSKSIDIDTYEEWEMAEAVFLARKNHSE